MSENSDPLVVLFCGARQDGEEVDDVVEDLGGDIGSRRRPVGFASGAVEESRESRGCTGRVCRRGSFRGGRLVLETQSVHRGGNCLILRHCSSRGGDERVEHGRACEQRGQPPVHIPGAGLWRRTCGRISCSQERQRHDSLIDEHGMPPTCPHEAGDRPDSVMLGETLPCSVGLRARFLAQRVDWRSQEGADAIDHNARRFGADADIVDAPDKLDDVVERRFRGRVGAPCE